MPVISTESMSSNVRLQRRAHHVLAYLAHFYIHSLPVGSTPIIPASIAVPLCATSAQLGVAPVLTYADTVEWNIIARDPSQPLAPGNLRVLTTFSGTDDEEAFYQCCANIELFGTDALSHIAAYENLGLRDASRIRVDTLRTIASRVGELTTLIDDLTEWLKACHGSCSPRVFYDSIRPWFRGSSSGSTPWIYEGVAEADFDPEWENLSGPSGGQSTLMHSLDLFLDVDHSMEKTKDGRTPVEARQGNDRLFMRRYVLLQYQTTYAFSVFFPR
jgi:indoleamine 2,3-dioxygenase